MNIVIDKTRPICPQIFEYVCLLISTKKFELNSKLPSVREFAVKLEVNPNTVQKSYDDLEKVGVIYSVKGSGWYVGNDPEISKSVVEKLIFQKTKNYISEMVKLGVVKEEIYKYLQESLGDDSE